MHEENMKEQFNYINKEGKLETGDGLYDMIKFIEDGFAVVEKNSKYNYINEEGEYISDVWFDYAYNFKEGFGKVELNGKWNYMDKEGNITMR